jgi:arylsulfatase A-like enzyme
MINKSHNVLLIQVDQMNADCLSVLGHPQVYTPNLDRLALGGSLFQNAAAQSPICLPSRISMLSGQYCSTNRQFGFFGLCDRRTPWLQTTLKQAGYHTAAFGKFHVASVGDSTWDFDVAAPTLPEEMDLARPAGNHYQNYCQQQQVAWPTDQIHGHNPFAFGEWSPSPSSATLDQPFIRQRACRSDVALEHSLETWTTNQCLEFITSHQKKGPDPFFIWLSYDRPHYPTSLPEPWFSKISDKMKALGLEQPPTLDEMAELPEIHQKIYREGFSRLNPEVDDDSFRFVLASYFVLIEWIDAEIGRVMESLENLGLADTTTIIFTADHGDESGVRGLFDKARRCASQAVVRPPLIIRPAPMLKGQRGAIISQPVELVDLFKTICTLTKTPAPDRIEGCDLTGAVLEGSPLPEDRPVFCEDYYTKTVIAEGWKLVFDAGDKNNNQLYDLRQNRYSLANLYRQSDCQEQRIRLKRHLMSFLMQRACGPYDQSDIDFVLQCIDPNSQKLGLLHMSQDMSSAVSFRAACVIHDGRPDYGLLVPYWNQPMAILDGNYKKVDPAVPLDLDLCERLLDKGLRNSILRSSSISHLEWGRIHPCDA